MKKTMFYCDLCGEETKLPTVVKVSWPGIIGEAHFDLCDKCREEVKELAPQHMKRDGNMRNIAMGCLKSFIKKKN